MINTNNRMYIRKKQTRKNAFRLKESKSIPYFLKNTITENQDGTFSVECVEGKETVSSGCVIGYESSNKTQSGYNAWVISDETRVTEKDGAFYDAGTIAVCCPITETIPEWLKKAPIINNLDGSFSVVTKWGKSTGNIGEAFWVCYGENPDGSLDVNILTKTEKSFFEYFVCEKNGKLICPLYEYNERL